MPNDIARPAVRTKPSPKGLKCSVAESLDFYVEFNLISHECLRLDRDWRENEPNSAGAKLASFLAAFGRCRLESRLGTGS